MDSKMINHNIKSNPNIITKPIAFHPKNEEFKQLIDEQMKDVQEKFKTFNIFETLNIML